MSSLRTPTAVLRTLRGGKAAPRAGLSTALADRGLTLSASQVGHLLMRAELDCLLVSGPVRGRASTHMLLDERVPDPDAKLTVTRHWLSWSAVISSATGRPP